MYTFSGNMSQTDASEHRSNGEGAGTEPVPHAMPLHAVQAAADEPAADEFVSRVSHDLRTPLAAIKAAIGVLLAMVDATRIERALLNLMENAQRYGPQGGTIRFDLDSHDGEAIFSVIDEGPGVPEEAAERILRGEPAVSGGSGKLGLGLPIART